MNPFVFRCLFLTVAVFCSLTAMAQPSLPPSFSPGFSEASPWTHRPSGLSFPVKVAGFSRGDALQYDDTGLDVSVGYNFYDPRIVATFYVYPTGGLTIEQEMARRQKEITDKYPDAKLEKADQIEITPKKISVQRAVYAIPHIFEHVEGPMRSILLVGPCGKDFVEYRISYALAGGETAENAVARFLQDFSWAAKATAP